MKIVKCDGDCSLDGVLIF